MATFDMKNFKDTLTEEVLRSNETIESQARKLVENIKFESKDSKNKVLSNIIALLEKEVFVQAVKDYYIKEYNYILSEDELKKFRKLFKPTEDFERMNPDKRIWLRDQKQKDSVIQLILSNKFLLKDDNIFVRINDNYMVGCNSEDFKRPDSIDEINEVYESRDAEEYGWFIYVDTCATYKQTTEQANRDIHKYLDHYNNFINKSRELIKQFSNGRSASKALYDHWHNDYDDVYNEISPLWVHASTLLSFTNYSTALKLIDVMKETCPYYLDFSTPKWLLTPNIISVSYSTALERDIEHVLLEAYPEWCLHIHKFKNDTLTKDVEWYNQYVRLAKVLNPEVVNRLITYKTFFDNTISLSAVQ